MKKDGFTLIELLAVIVILAVIALISTPIIVGIINDTKNEAFKDSAYGIMKAGELGYANDLLNNNVEEVVFTYENGVETSNPSGKKLNYNGSKPQNGTIKVNVQGQVALAIHNGTLCASKSYEETEILVTEKSESECVIPDYIYNEGQYSEMWENGYVYKIAQSDIKTIYNPTNIEFRSEENTTPAGQEISIVTKEKINLTGKTKIKVEFDLNQFRSWLILRLTSVKGTRDDNIVASQFLHDYSDNYFYEMDVSSYQGEYYIDINFEAPGYNSICQGFMKKIWLE